MVKCPRCGNQVANLVAPDPQLVVAVKKDGVHLPSEMCETCLSSYEMPVKGGAKILAEDRSKEQQRLAMWKSRVNILKTGRSHMANRKYAEAAAFYEKYIKLLEIVFDLKKGENLTPKMFKDSARTQELTVIATVYWDLLRIYDTHVKFFEKQNSTAAQLADFLPYTPIFPDIIKKAKEFGPSSRNPSIFKHVVRQATKEKARCFIATSAFGAPKAEEVLRLRYWRDNILKQRRMGRNFINFYYRFSPCIARFLDRHPIMKVPTRMVIRFFLLFLGS